MGGIPSWCFEKTSISILKKMPQISIRFKINPRPREFLFFKKKIFCEDFFFKTLFHDSFLRLLSQFSSQFPIDFSSQIFNRFFKSNFQTSHFFLNFLHKNKNIKLRFSTSSWSIKSLKSIETFIGLFFIYFLKKLRIHL